MEFRTPETVMALFNDLVKGLALKGYALQTGESNNPLSKHNENLLTAWFLKHATSSTDGLTDVTLDLLWRFVKDEQYDLRWQDGMVPLGVARKQGLPEKPKGVQQKYTDPAIAVQEKEALERQYKGWQAAIQIMKGTHAGHPVVDKRRRSEIKALIDEGQKEPSKPELCLAKIRKLQQSWGN